LNIPVDPGLELLTAIFEPTRYINTGISKENLRKGKLIANNSFWGIRNDTPSIINIL
jgi:hypothetical protein